MVFYILQSVYMNVIPISILVIGNYLVFLIPHNISFNLLLKALIKSD